MSHPSTYEPLLSRHDSLDDIETLSTKRLSPPSRQRLSLWIAFALVISLVMNGFQYHSSLSMATWRGDKQLYTPVLDSLVHKNHIFPFLTDTSKWHGPPTDQVDAEWDNLYSFGLSAIPGDQMRRMINVSDPIHGQKDRYLISLDVFHQLHCLNTVRRYIWPERYPQIVAQRYKEIEGPSGPVIFDHIDHCINAVRESLMCNADITPAVWATGPDNNSRVQFNVLHTCRDWSSVTDWARKNQLKTYMFSDKNNTNGELLRTHDIGKLEHDHSVPVKS